MSKTFDYIVNGGDDLALANATINHMSGYLGFEIDENERLRNAMKEACDLLAERKYGSPARSPGHNARLCLEAALEPAAPKQPGAT
jgi:hypothetical protein